MTEEPRIQRWLGGLIRRVHTLVIDRDLDRRGGTETSGVLASEELSIDSPNAKFASEYAPTPTLVFRRMLTYLSGVDFRSFVFVDFGCGKGRTLLQASALPFLRIEGVEFAADLCRVALRNAATLVDHQQREGRIIIHHLDATNFAIPPESCVFYFYNPFGQQVLDRVLDNIEASYRSNPRTMYFLYLNDKYRESLERRDFIKPLPKSRIAAFLDRTIAPEPFSIYRTSR